MSGELDERSANEVIAKLLFLDSRDPARPIELRIDSPGGAVTGGIAIIETMRTLKAPLSTLCLSACASMAAVVLMHGVKGKRFARAGAQMMLHALAVDASFDVKAHSRELARLRERTFQLIAEGTGRTLGQVRHELSTERVFSTEAAQKYGIIDAVAP